MAAAVFRATLRGWRTGVPPGCRLRRLSQTQGPPDYPSFVESVDEYQFVERLLPPTSIPEPPKHEHYPTPSGWQPPRDPPPNLPYFVRRSRMHNIPVYKDITHGNRQMTVIRKVEGDIWLPPSPPMDLTHRQCGSERARRYWGCVPSEAEQKGGPSGRLGLTPHPQPSLHCTSLPTKPLLGSHLLQRTL
uniref:Large ribosomal subunit protein mL49 n=2 Tax=Canis lupus familiaris TaxID=9615 RepID=A0A8P0PN51_CANLF